MKKMKMCFPREKTFVDGFEENILDCKASRIDGLFLNAHIVFFQKGFQIPTGYDSVLSCVGFKILHYQQQTDGDVIPSVVRHSGPSCGGFSVNIAHQKEREKGIFLGLP